MLNKACISYFEIIILIIGLFAFSYLIYSYTNPSNNKEIIAEEKKTDSTETASQIYKTAALGCFQIIALMIGLLAFSYLIYKSTEISAAETQLICCSKTKSGKWCEMDLPINCDKSDPSYVTYLSNCSEVDAGWCEKGCCQSNKDGICNPVSSKGTCIDLNGTFDGNDKKCAGPNCRLGCCQLGSGDAQLTTQAQCDFLANSQNPTIPKEWKPELTNEVQCKYSVQGSKEGACVFYSGKNKTCVYTTLDDCIVRTGNATNFDVSGKYCSDPSLNTTCKAKDHKGCIEGKDDVYWFDSCNNHEGVAQDCDLFSGTYCGKDDSKKYICKDIDCVIDGVERKNGESWCEYDNVIGRGKDPAGSRHVRHVCYFGTERTEPCVDYRNNICVASTATANDGTEFSQAACRFNNWGKCLELNAKKSTSEMLEKCPKNPDCWVKHIDMDGSFKFDVCLPEYPPGFDLYDETSESVTVTGDSLCSIATQRCTETWICGIFGCWCVDNCKCHTDYFTEEMNEFCISLGDCGAWINYIDVWTGGGIGTKSTGEEEAPPNTLGPGYIGFYKARAGTKPADPGTFEFFNSINDENLTNLETYELSMNSSTNITQLNEELAKTQKEMNIAKANLQTALDSGDQAGIEQYSAEYMALEAEYLDILSQLEVAESTIDPYAFQAELNQVAGSMGSPLLLYMISQDNASLDPASLNQVQSNPTTAGSYFNAFSSVRAAISAQIVQKDIKAGGFEMIAALLAGLIAYIITQSIMMAFLAALLAYLFALMWIMFVYIDFHCGMWERPSGNADCNKCNVIDVPCTKYRCQSLGELCKFINEGTSDELCLALEENESLPVIQPFYSVITQGYKYTEISQDGFEIRTLDGKCVDPFKMIHMGITVDPFAKCRFDTDPTKKWEEMFYEFGLKGAQILPAHQLDLMYPSPESVRNSFAGQTLCNTTQNPCKEQYVDGKKTMVCQPCNLTEAEIEELTKTEIFVKCKTASGRQNPNPYHIRSCVNPGPDLTPPVIRTVTPNTGSYVKYNVTNMTIITYVDEPSQCRWSIEDVSFDDMDDEMNCSINVITDYESLMIPGVNASEIRVEYGLPCFANLNVTNSTKFYIRCQDLSEERNNMTQSYIYEIQHSQSPLTIIDFRPVNGQEIISGQDPASVVLKVETKGGAENGDSKCQWYDNRVDYNRDFFTGDYTNKHDYNWTSAPRGNYNITFDCWDVAGNEAQNSTLFKLIIDSMGPVIIRVFNDGGLRITTDEPAQCRYSTKKNFVFSNGTEMTTSDKIEHFAPWTFGVVYYIECRDEFGNPGPRIMASPFETYQY